MDFNEFKKKAIEVKDKIVKGTDKVIISGAEKIKNSSITIHSLDDLDLVIEKSKNTKYTSSETGEEKTKIGRSLLIIGDPETSFFKEALYILPIVKTKAFTQGIEVKLAESDLETIDYSKYGVKTFPTMIVFENTEVFKVITGKLNILKLVKSFSLDINKSIDDFVELEITSVDDLKNKVVEKATEKVVEVKGKVVDKATEKVEEVKEKAVKKAEEINDKANAKVEEIKEKAIEKVEEVKEKAVEKVDEVKEKVDL